MELITQYFPDLTDLQLLQLEGLEPLYREWNEKINVISRKDIDQLYLHHVLHSMVLAKYFDFSHVNHVLDAGTGGGFPGVPLAILFPNTHFTLVDSTAKKIKVVDEIAKATGLENVTAQHARVEDLKGNYDLITSRAVSTLTQMVAWTKHLMKEKHWLILKGGDPKELRKELPPVYKLNFKNVSDYFPEHYYEGKLIVSITTA